MKNKKAQLGQTISWFVGFLVIVFILFLFLFFGIAKTAENRATQGKSSIGISQTDSYNKSEQQRQMFVLFEDEYENTQVYSKIERVIISLEKDTPANKKTQEYEDLKEGIESINSKKVTCFNITAIDSSIQTLGDPYASNPPQISHRYFKFPETLSTNQKIYGPNKEGAPAGSYSFFFPEKSFALIKYIPTKCS